jgi:hypothetical protein
MDTQRIAIKNGRNYICKKNGIDLNLGEATGRIWGVGGEKKIF